MICSPIIPLHSCKPHGIFLVTTKGFPLCRRLTTGAILLQQLTAFPTAHVRPVFHNEMSMAGGDCERTLTEQHAEADTMPEVASSHSQFAPSTDVYSQLPDTWGQSLGPHSHVGGLSRTESGTWHPLLEGIWLIILITFQFHAPELIYPQPRTSSQWLKWHVNTKVTMISRWR